MSMIYPGITASGEGSGPPPPYTTTAVHFDGSTNLTTPTSLGAVNGPFGIFSIWCLQANSGDLVNPGTHKGGCFLDTANDDTTMQPSANGTSSDNNGIGFETFPAVGSGGFNIDTANSGPLPVGTWTNVIMSWDASAGKFAMYVNDVQITDLDPNTITNAPFDCLYDDGGWSVGILGGLTPGVGGWKASLGAFADLYFCTTATIVQSDNTILQADRRKFISALGKPVDLQTGGAPTAFILLKGDATTFPNNLAGTGAFTVANGSLTNASTSPSD